MFYSKTTGGFYQSGKTPSDAVEITEDEHKTLIDGQSNGKLILPDQKGHPTLVDRPPLTDDEKIANYRAAVGRHIDAQAQAFGFDSIITAVTYADEPADPLNQSYGVALRAWRSACWQKCREVLEVWQGGEAEPTVDEVIASLPAFVAP